MFCIGFHDVPEGSGWRGLHENTSVEFHAAYVLVAHPDMYVRRFETVLPGIHNKPELAFHYYSRHVQFFVTGSLPCVHALQRVSCNDTWRQCSCSTFLGFTAIRDTLGVMA